MPKSQIKIDQVFHALGDPTRRAILEKLSEAPTSVTNLAAPLNVTPTAVIQHLQILEQSGLVHTEKLGRIRTCRLQTTGIEVAQKWLSARRTIWDRRLDKLATLLAEEQKS
jgi:DNA-binding transcriptional ArsR family regulator